MKRILAVTIVLVCVGCGLTGEQRATLLDAEARLQQYKPKVAAVIERVRKGELPVDEGLALIAEYAENEAADSTLVGRLRSQDIPWWAFLIMGAPAIAGVVGLKKYVGVLKIAKAMVIGVEETTPRRGTVRRAIREAALDAGVQDQLKKIVDELTPPHA